jgi:hypothetical protein
LFELYTKALGLRLLLFLFAKLCRYCSAIRSFLNKQHFFYASLRIYKKAGKLGAKYLHIASVILIGLSSDKIKLP